MSKKASDPLPPSVHVRESYLKPYQSDIQRSLEVMYEDMRYGQAFTASGITKRFKSHSDRFYALLSNHLCGQCGGTGVEDSGGQNPDGSWIDLTCGVCGGSGSRKD